MDVVALNLFSSRARLICREMGLILRQAAISPNIKDRHDYSCAIFDNKGGLIAQAAHIPVHLGSMAYAMQDLTGQFDWQPGDCLIVNNPFLGGTHLPDITLISPLFVAGKCVAFVANRAHHANIGADQPGSMPVSSSIFEEGLVLGPDFLLKEGQLQQPILEQLSSLTKQPARDIKEWARHPEMADFFAQLSANKTGLKALEALINKNGVAYFQTATKALNEYGSSLATASLAQIPDGCYKFEDFMDDDGLGGDPLPIRLALTATSGKLDLDFTGTAGQAAGNLNCPLSVTVAAVFYVIRALLPAHTPTCKGLFASFSLKVPVGSLLHALWPAGVAAGNVETSMRIVDVVLGALAQAVPDRIPAAAQGTMNNLAMGARPSMGVENAWDYYETIAGGLGGHAAAAGQSAVQAHMTNTLNTPLESLELHYPVRLKRYAIRRNSGGAGHHSGGDGVIREFEFTAPASFSLLTERRQRAPWGLAGGKSGQKGENRLNGQVLPAKITSRVDAGDVLTLMTPGGGGYGEPD